MSHIPEIPQFNRCANTNGGMCEGYDNGLANSNSNSYLNLNVINLFVSNWCMRKVGRMPSLVWKKNAQETLSHGERDGAKSGEVAHGKIRSN